MVIRGRLYWLWRLSYLSRPWYAIKTFVFLHLNAYRTAEALEDCARCLGQMKHSDEAGLMLMSTQVRGRLIVQAYNSLPSWKVWNNEQR